MTMIPGPGGIPLQPISWDDGQAIVSVISGYLAYLRQKGASAQQQQTVETLQALRARFSEALLAKEKKQGMLLFNMDELLALTEALRGFTTLIRWMIPPSQGRDEVIEGLHGLHQQFAQLLTPHMN